MFTEEELEKEVRDCASQLMTRLFMLDGKEVVPVTSISSFNAFMKNPARRRLAVDEVNGYIVSTVFLTIDHQYSYIEDAPPLFFETMVFKEGSAIDLFCERYTTWDQAMDGHNQIVQCVKDGYFDEEDFCLRVEKELEKQNDKRG